MTMPPWSAVEPTDLVCVQCSASFTAKRSGARFCSEPCRGKARPKRAYDPTYRRPYSAKRRIEHGETLRAQERARMASLREFIQGYKLQHGCADCGYREHHVALDFDHVRGVKLLNVCQAKSIAQAQSEIEKCEVVCACCHRIRTYVRMTGEARMESEIKWTGTGFAPSADADWLPAAETLETAGETPEGPHLVVEIDGVRTLLRPGTRVTRDMFAG
jgi:hypothetical protein